jgi:hypothetical protein
MNKSFRVHKAGLLNTHPMNLERIGMKSINNLLVTLILMAIFGTANAGDTTAIKQMQYWSDKAGTSGNSEKGKTFFTSTHGKEWSCSSCHGNPPTTQGKHASTNKPINPLAPSINPDAFTDQAKSDKWFRRNCNDVLGRECQPQEKADILAYLISLKK